MDHLSYAMSPRKAMSEVEDTSMQKVGMHEDKEKNMYEPYMLQERHYEQWDQHVRKLGSVKYTQ